MAAKFHERFDIEAGLEEAKRRFVNRVCAAVPNSPLYDHITVKMRLVYKLGVEYHSPRLREIVGEDF